MNGLESLLPGMGVFGGFVVLIGYLFVANRTDRREYRAEIRRVEAAHDVTQNRLDEQMERRRKAEDALADTNRQLKELRVQVEKQDRQIAELRAEVARLAGGQ
ncbi:MAG: hypothetical protein ACRDSK_13690 [Actinophytocola sp.]|uniref:hypothetical protein n=1 Tax=Actinophytocola sp. TaxID=1872138 RepID=UPI003D6B6DE6